MNERALLLTMQRGAGSPDGFDDTRVCYWYDPETEHWWVYLPRGGAGQLIDHKVTVHEDGTISATPSILLGKRHGYLERGDWREV